MKITGISDLHGYLPNNIAECDVVCICGDIVPLDYQRSLVKSLSWFYNEFVPWTNSLKCNKVIFVGGNHDFFLEELHKTRKETVWDDEQFNWVTKYKFDSADNVIDSLFITKPNDKLVYLCDSTYEYEGVKFYGTPWVADLKNWAFYKSNENLKEIYSKIPDNCDVLITHMPPKMCGCGEVLQYRCHNTGADYGSQVLADAIMTKTIKWSLCGHVHSGSHIPVEYDNNKFVVNCSVKNENYDVEYKPLVFDLKN